MSQKLFTMYLLCPASKGYLIGQGIGFTGDPKCSPPEPVHQLKSHRFVYLLVYAVLAELCAVLTLTYQMESYMYRPSNVSAQKCQRPSLLFLELSSCSQRRLLIQKHLRTTGHVHMPPLSHQVWSKQAQESEEMWIPEHTINPVPGIYKFLNRSTLPLNLIFLKFIKKMVSHEQAQILLRYKFTLL